MNSCNVEIVDRKLWLDALRGVAMLLVVYGHCVREWTEYFVFTSPVKMPLFFVISGFLFKPRGGNQKEFYKSIFFKLIVPWLILGMIPNPTIEQFFNLLSGKKVWFMPCLIVSEIIWFYIHKCSSNDLQIVIIGFFACILGFVLNHSGFFRYAMIDTAFIVQIFFVMGYLIRKNKVFPELRWQFWIPILSIIYILMCITVLWLFPGKALDVHHNSYFNIPLCSLMIGIGCISLFVFFKNINFSPKWLVYIGQNTLIIYMMHSVAFSIFSRCLGLLNVDLVMPLPLLGLMKSLFACVMCCLLAMLTNKYIPEIVGKKRVKFK